jgi:hypothetical protein
VDTEGEVVQADNKGRLYTVEPTCGLLEGDLDCNCVVDVKHVTEVASRWRTKAGQEGWNPDYDFDKDDDVDIADIMWVVARWGDRCPAEP